MSDQQAPQNGDTPAVAGPTQAPGTQDAPPYGDPNDPYEKRYHDLRSWTDRVSTEASELRERQQQWDQEKQAYGLLMSPDADEDTRRQAAEYLGYDIPDEVEDVEPAEWADEEEFDPRSEIQALREELKSKESEAQQEALQNLQMDLAHRDLAQLGIEDDEDRRWIFERALATPMLRPTPETPFQRYDMETAVKQFQAWETGRQKKWASVKRGAPYVPPGGIPANEVPDPGTGHNSRMNRAMRALQEEQE